MAQQSAGNGKAVAAIVDHRPKCANAKCGRTLMEYAARPWSIRCKRCGHQNRSDDLDI